MIVSTKILIDRYKDYSNPLDKIKRETDRGALIRLTKGIYETDRSVNPYLLASSIFSPSYLSFDFALSYYGLIPERVYAITSATLNVRKNKTTINEFGRYEYSDIPASAFSEGNVYIKEGDYVVRIASKEKAICDSLCKWPVATSVKSLKQLMFDDKRIDKDEFATCDFALLRRLAALYRKTNLVMLIKLIDKEYLDERLN